MARRLLCLHGHFYQPPRENPWIEAVEIQDSAAPFHDWNERVSAECYGPNGAARIKAPSGRIVGIVNNYLHLSFNFGPTLLAWLERRRPDVYGRVLDADRRSLEERGHGNAIAQGYNHAVLPLCSARDRRTQIRWGLEDFRRRFGREAEGFWLPETAADQATLADVAAEGVRFTVLSPSQAVRVRPPGGQWQDATGGRFDPARPYRVRTGAGDLAVFFYDAPISRGVAFGDSLSSAELLVQRLDAGFDPARGHDEVVTVAVDGETFGHHRKGADEVLAAALLALAARPDVEVVSLGQALELCPPEWEAELAEGSSWSCGHGVERWRADCGCSTGGQPGWHQGWRAPLRDALDTLSGRFAALFEREGSKLLRDPWAARDRYVELLLDPDREEAAAFLAREAGRPLEPAEQVVALRLLEMQRHALLMYTSCGFFFSDVSGIETVQLLRYAARAIQLAREVSGVDLEPPFRSALARAPSNLPELRDAARVYELMVKPSMVPLEAIAAHHAIAGVAQGFAPAGRLFCYRYRTRSWREEAAGPATLAVGRVEIESVVTQERRDVVFCVLHFGAADFRCGLRPVTDADAAGELERSLFSRLDQLSLAQVVREIDRNFTGRDYGLRDLFLDERRRLAELLLDETMDRYGDEYLEVFDQNRRLMEFLREIDSPIPAALKAAADVALSRRLHQSARTLAQARADLATVHGEMQWNVELGRRLGAKLDLEPAKRELEALVKERTIALVRAPEAQASARALELADLLDLAERLGLALDLWEAQNVAWAWAASGRMRLNRYALARLARRLWIDEGTLDARVRAASAAAAELVGAALDEGAATLH